MSPEQYFQEMQKTNIVQSKILVLEAPKEPVKKQVKVKKKLQETIGYDNTVGKDSNYWVERTRYYCGEYGLSKNQCDTAVRIGYAESGFRPCAKYGFKGNVCNIDEHICIKTGKSCSSATGIFMFTSSTWKGSSSRYGFAGASKYDGDANIQVGLQKMKNEGFSAWNASSHNW